MSKTTKYELALVRELVESISISLLNLSLMVDCVNADRSRLSALRHFNNAKKSANVTVSIANKLEGYNRLDLVEGALTPFSGGKYKATCDNIEEFGISYPDFLRDIANGVDIQYRF